MDLKRVRRAYFHSSCAILHMSLCKSEPPATGDLGVALGCISPFTGAIKKRRQPERERGEGDVWTKH